MSSFDRVKKHLESNGAQAPAPEALHDDLEALVRRCDEVKSLGQALAAVELSPYMKSLLRVSGIGSRARKAARVSDRVAAAGV